MGVTYHPDIYGLPSTLFSYLPDLLLQYNHLGLALDLLVGVLGITFLKILLQ